MHHSWRTFAEAIVPRLLPAVVEVRQEISRYIVNIGSGASRIDTNR